jgi:hypothetical protein
VNAGAIDASRLSQITTLTTASPDNVDNDHKSKALYDTETNTPSRLWHGASSSHGYTEAWSLSRKDAQAVTAQTDSGYASLVREKGAAPRHDHLDTEEALPVADTDAMVEAEDNDIGTVYSDDRSQASVSRTQRYISEFVDHLFGKIKHHIEDYDGGRLADCLPELLRAFALKVGQSSSTRGHLEVMYFVHKHRRYRLPCSLVLYTTNTCIIRAITLSLQDRLKEDEAQGAVEVEDCGPDAAGMSLEDKLSMWAQKASAAEPEHEMHEIEAEELPEIEPLEDEVDLNDLYRYQSLITESSAFDWLVGSLQRELQLANSAVDGMMNIRRRILQGLPSTRHISRKQAVPSVQVTFTAPWDPISFIEEQGYDVEIEDILGKVITLTGSSADVQATTC